MWLFDNSNLQMNCCMWAQRKCPPKLTKILPKFGLILLLNWRRYSNNQMLSAFILFFLKIKAPFFTKLFFQDARGTSAIMNEVAQFCLVFSSFFRRIVSYILVYTRSTTFGQLNSVTGKNLGKYRQGTIFVKYEFKYSM